MTMGTAAAAPLRAFLVDDHAIVRCGVRGYLELIDDIMVVGEARWPDIEVIAVTSFLEEAKVHSALEAGAAGYLLKDADADQVAAAIRAAAAGQCHLDPAAGKLLAESPCTPRPAAGTLTIREREVLAQVASGATNQQIAHRLGIAERTAIGPDPVHQVTFVTSSARPPTSTGSPSRTRRYQRSRAPPGGTQVGQLDPQHWAAVPADLWPQLPAQGVFM